MPAGLDAASDDVVRAFFEGLAPHHREEWVRRVEEARKPETRQARLETVESLRAGGRTR